MKTEIFNERFDKLILWLFFSILIIFIPFVHEVGSLLFLELFSLASFFDRDSWHGIGDIPFKLLTITPLILHLLLLVCIMFFKGKKKIIVALSCSAILFVLLGILIIVSGIKQEYRISYISMIPFVICNVFLWHHVFKGKWGHTAES